MTVSGDFEARRRAVAERLFESLALLDHFAGERRSCDRDVGRITVSEFYRVATDPDVPLTGRLLSALNDDPRLRADFEHLLHKTARVRIGRVAAASSGPVATREGHGFRLSLRRSRAHDDQVYITIDLDRADEPPPAHIFVLGEAVRYCKVALPPPTGGTIQLLADGGSDIVRALGDHRSEVFLR